MIRLRQHLMLAGLAGLAAACSPASPGGGGTCEAACTRMRRLDCEIGRPTHRGAPCEDVCHRAEANGVSFGTACLASLTTCEEAGRCVK